MASRKKTDNVHQLDKYELRHRREAMNYLARIDAKPRGMRTAIVEEQRGTYWKDKAIIRFAKDGEIKAPPGYEPTEDEQNRIAAEFREIQWPEIIPTRTVLNPHPNFLKTSEKNTFDFYDGEGNIRMRQLRFEIEENGVMSKIYVTYTYWSDGIWRTMEPEGLLPLWGVDRWREQSVAFIHEGAKAARAIADMITDGSVYRHPWGEELRRGLHLGWVGGAQNPGRTDWSFLREKNFSKAYIVLDRDRPGETALSDISRAIRMNAEYIKFPNTFPHKFDMADPWPENLYADIDGVRMYIGPAMDEFCGPATWMTDEQVYYVKSKKGEGNKLLKKVKYTLTDAARETVVYMKHIDRFVFINEPHVQYSTAHFNNAVSDLSDVSDTAKIFLKEERKFASNFTFDPSTVEKIIHAEGGGIRLNLYRPSLIRPVEGNYEPWIEFMEHLIPKKPDLDYVLRWIATLIARPDVRMRYAMLLVSEQTGVGKTTLAEKIIVPLVGRSNCSFPREGSLDGDFNDWVGAKRLAYVPEIYQGHNFKVTNALKSSISDGMIRVNAKYDREYEIPNWCHFLASSNSMKAIFLDLEDRRWLIPVVTEARWGKGKFDQFYKWIGTGGLQIVRGWADRYEDYVTTGEHAPMTDRKFEVINEGKSQAYVMAEGIGRAIREAERPIVICDVDLHRYIVSRFKNTRINDSKLDLRKACINGGAILHKNRGGDGRFSFNRIDAYALVNDRARTLIEEGEGNDVVRRLYIETKGVSSLIEEEF